MPRIRNGTSNAPIVSFKKNPMKLFKILFFLLTHRATIITVLIAAPFSFIALANYQANMPAELIESATVRFCDGSISTDVRGYGIVEKHKPGDFLLIVKLVDQNQRFCMWEYDPAYQKRFGLRDTVTVITNKQTKKKTFTQYKVCRLLSAEKDQY